MNNLFNDGLFSIEEHIRENTRNFSVLLDKNKVKENRLTSAVLIPIIIHNGEQSLLFTKRSNSLARHRGQVSFPGGVLEKKDKSLIDTALRETCEEIGIERNRIRVIGQLPPVIPNLDNIIYPFVGIIDGSPEFQLNSNEVARVFCIPLKWLAETDHSMIRDHKTSGGDIRKVWYFDFYEGELLWGITAKITIDFLEIIKK